MRNPLTGLLVISLIIGMAMITGVFRVNAQPQNLVTANVQTVASVTVIGASTNDHLTSNSSAALGLSSVDRARAITTGDFNADGFQDIAIGAPDTTFVANAQTRTNAGSVYIVFGRENFPLPTTIDTNAAAITNRADIIIRGTASAVGKPVNLGFAVASGDVNGDGVEDLLMGAPGADLIVGDDDTRQDSGAVYVLFGTNTLVTGQIIDLDIANTADALIRGVSAGDKFGTSIAVGNVGGPSGVPQAQADVEDILIGAPGTQGPAPAATPRADGGAAYLVYGGAVLNRVGAATTVLDLGDPGPLNFDIIFGNTGDHLGNSVAIGDLNAGGAGDLIVGAPLANRPAGIANTPPGLADTGAVYGVFGGTNLNPDTGTVKAFDVASAVATSRQNISIYGEGANDLFGASVALGDVTGDGTVDLAAGAPGAGGPSNGRANGGEAYLFVGGANFNPPFGGSETRKDIALDGENLTVFGAAAGDRLGATVAIGQINSAGNTDTIPDLLLGAPGASSGNGSVSVLYGGSANILLVATRDLSIDQDDLRFLGETGSQLGWAIAADDVDGNTGGDLIVGAPLADAVISQAVTRTDAGKAYVLLADPTDVPPVNQNPIVEVTSPNGGETVNGGSTFPITWTASDPDGNATLQRFEIKLSTDGGATFNVTIATNVSPAGGSPFTFNWDVPTGLNTNSARIQVTAFDNAGGSTSDSSDENFTITDAGVVVTLIFPNGGETFNFGQQIEISWTVPDSFEDQIAGFDLFFTPDDGATFTAITPLNPLEPALAPGVRTFPWTVPSICTTRARVLVVATSVTNALSSDSSNSTFTISEPGPTIDASRLDLNGGRTKLILKTAQPAQGSEVKFVQNTTVEISATEAGTTFFAFSNVKVKGSGVKLKAKGLINGQTLGAFFPDGATRFLRVTNPVCGVTLLKVMRVGGQLVVVPSTAVQLQKNHQVWQ